MTSTRPSYVALALLAGTAIVPANATMMGAPSPPTISVPRVTPPTVRPPSINIPNVTPGGGINTNIRDNMRTNRGARGSDSGRSTKRSGGSGKSYSDEGRANRSGGDSSASRAKVGGQAAAAAAAGAAGGAGDSAGDGKAAAYSGPTDQMMWSADNCDPSDGNYVAPPSKKDPKPIAALQPIDLPPVTTAPTPPPQVATVPEDDGPTTPDAMAPVDTTSTTPPPPPPQVVTVPVGDGPTTPDAKAPIDPPSTTPPPPPTQVATAPVDPPSTTPPPPAVETKTFVLSGPDGQSSPLDIRQYNTELPLKGPKNSGMSIEGTWEAEQARYKNEDGTENYTVVPGSQPTRKQDCAGNTIENLWGVKNLNVGADNFHKNIIQKFNVPEVAPSDSNVAVYFHGNDNGHNGEAGHIVTVTKVDSEGTHIISKDGNESVRQGVVSTSSTDPLIQSYPGGIKYYHVDTNKIKIGPQTIAGK